MKTSPTYQDPTHEEIALSAFLLWEKEGRQPGREMTYWLRAEAEIRALRQKKAETAAAQSARRWPSQSRPAPSRIVKSRATGSAASKATVAVAQKPVAKVERATASKATLPSRSVSVRKSGLKPAR